MTWIHTHENGRVAWGATLRWLLAHIWPMWDGARGRAYTAREQRLFLRRRGHA